MSTDNTNTVWFEEEGREVIPPKPARPAKPAKEPIEKGRVVIPPKVPPRRDPPPAPKR